jgi:hypothetical protein
MTHRNAVLPEVAKATFECRCGGEALRVSHDPDPEWDYGIELAFWSVGQVRRPDWRYRLRHVWRILRTGTPYSDYIILNHEDADRLAEWLLALPKHEVPSV